MQRKTIGIGAEPKGRLYRMLLDHAAKTCSAYLLVRQPWISLSSHGEEVQERLSAFLVSEKKSTNWPGTQLLGRQATVLRYELRPESTAVLRASAERSFQWQHPELPEDLCILRQDGSPWLVSIAHESEAYLELSDDEQKRFTTDLPELSELLI